MKKVFIIAGEASGDLYAKEIIKKKKVSNKYVTIFFGNLNDKNKSKLNISFVAKKKLGNAVKRNKIKRRVREIFRKGSFANTIHGMIVFSVFKPFGGLSYSNAVIEIESAVRLFVSGKNKK